MTWLRTKESAASSGLTHRVLFTRGANHGLGSVYVYADRATKNEFEYPGYNKSGSLPGRVDGACEDNNQHRKHSGIQQHVKTSCCWHEVWRQQRGKLGSKKAALKLMAGGPSKINQPNSHPSNPIHKAAMAAQTGKPQQENKEPTSDQGLQEIEPVQSDPETNKTAFIIGVVGLVALVLVAWR